MPSAAAAAEGDSRSQPQYVDSGSFLTIPSYRHHMRLIKRYAERKVGKPRNTLCRHGYVSFCDAWGSFRGEKGQPWKPNWTRREHAGKGHCGSHSEVKWLG